MSKPTEAKRIAAILLHYRSMVAELVQDRHSHSITTEQLTALDAEAAAAIVEVVREARIDELEHIACHNEETTWIEDIDQWKIKGQSPSLEVWERLDALRKPDGGEAQQ